MTASLPPVVRRAPLATVSVTPLGMVSVLLPVNVSELIVRLAVRSFSDVASRTLLALDEPATDDV